MACSTTPVGASTVAATRSIASRARSGLLTLTFNISQLPGPRNWAMAGGSNGYRAALVRRQLTPGPISSLPGTAGLPPFISSSTTSSPELSTSVPGRGSLDVLHLREAAAETRDHLLHVLAAERVGEERRQLAHLVFLHAEACHLLDTDAE